MAENFGKLCERIGFRFELCEVGNRMPVRVNLISLATGKLVVRDLNEKQARQWLASFSGKNVSAEGGK